MLSSVFENPHPACYWVLIGLSNDHRRPTDHVARTSHCKLCSQTVAIASHRGMEKGHSRPGLNKPRSHK